jgi:hypothetical protein
MRTLLVPSRPFEIEIVTKVVRISVLIISTKALRVLNSIGTKLRSQFALVAAAKSEMILRILLLLTMDGALEFVAELK